VTHWRALIERDFLGAWDLKGRDWSLTIERVESRPIHDSKSQKERRKCVLYFRGKEKAMVAGPTICDAIEGMWGSDYEQWVGKRITLYPTTTTVGKKKGIPCVRVRPTAPRAGQPDAPGPMSEPVDREMRDKQDEAFGREPGED
jgi:hypothetical protein